MGNENGNREPVVTELRRDVHLRTDPSMLAAPSAASQVPQSERAIIDLLKLDKHAVAHPAPEAGGRMEYMVILDGIKYTRVAVKAALETLDDQTLSNLSQYPHQIMLDNNLSGSQNAGGPVSITQLLPTPAYRTASERLHTILNDQPET